MQNSLGDIDFTAEQFSYYVENYKRDNKIDTYIETLCEIITNNDFPGIIFENVKMFLHSSIIKKLEFEYSTRGFLEQEHRVEENKLW